MYIMVLSTMRIGPGNGLACNRRLAIAWNNEFTGR